MRTANPTLNAKTFERVLRGTDSAAMTLEGTVGRTGLLLAIMMVPAVLVWRAFYAAWDPATVMPWAIGGAIGGLVFAIVTTFKPTWAPLTAPIYAAFEGAFLGGISAIFEMKFQGIVIQAVALTFGTAICLLLAYRSGLVRATENFKLGVVAATGAIMMVYLASMVMRMFGTTMPYIHDSGPIGIGISVVIVTVAALNLVLDFDFIEKGVEAGAPKHMEWYAAFGLMVTLVWLYVEMLRLLSKLNSRD